MRLTRNEASRKASEVRILHPPQIVNNFGMTGQTIESKVAAAILEKSIGTIEIEGETYEIAPPSTATLILISEYVAQFPTVKKVDKKEIINSVLYNARFFRPLGNIAAVLILGAKGLVEKRKKKVVKRHFFGLIKRETETEEVVNREKILARQILENVRPSVLYSIVIQRLQDMEIGSFFAITTSLSEANLLRPTKEVED